MPFFVTNRYHMSRIDIIIVRVHGRQHASRVAYKRRQVEFLDTRQRKNEQSISEVRESCEIKMLAWPRTCDDLKSVLYFKTMWLASLASATVTWTCNSIDASDIQRGGNQNQYGETFLQWNPVLNWLKKRATVGWRNTAGIRSCSLHVKESCTFTSPRGPRVWNWGMTKDLWRTSTGKTGRPSVLLAATARIFLATSKSNRQLTTCLVWILP